ncbi:penicillin-binding protein [Alkalihalobacillus alcalophilus ATCC 27647 = CGMCC 1.3604]|uniref:Penicillin-binding protein n=1 Tax=Alkalihalobacillus alcalophilus ATCC 27647 = CGMCC 1.3604 TaxID=1218173 RepID=A0A094WMV4_ALKAL|nr:penicillin-binding protein 1A [Alkalihalobacillus alcalophilus]KGA99099.1 penicillin-binding protein [Alkalihalobacillus alcalophilus ATCC 27647 = CGMCC 1.3604]MED1563478.1 PBP1A family penicillin-binding protein [Alkalihalobacillus alcalophilus]THG90300.1 penicillin-binding protein [Alkalihalobacillus alcalophilus ATCC 27647 = CGMCC 1.3604]
MSDHNKSNPPSAKSRVEKRKQAQKNQTKPKKKGIWKKIFITLVALFMLAVVAGGITVFAIVQSSPELDSDKLILTQGSEIFDQNDQSVSMLNSSENRINIDYADIPDVLEDAFLSVEDVRFREHFGMDMRRFFGAVLANITDGFGAEGASTITQQLVKNLFLTDEKRLSRKIQEAYLAIQLEQKYSKDQILTMYLNQIYLGGGVYGVELASQRYFGKSIADLNLEDAALLAAIPRRPSFYDPIQNPENAESRRNVVLSLMEQHGKISSEEATAAKEVPIADQMNPTEFESYPYEAYYNFIMSELENIDGITLTDVYNSGLKVYTTLDVGAQEHLEEVLASDDYIAHFPDNELFQAGVSVLDTQTGAIKALGSGREDTGYQLGLNYATDIKRQPGSTIKPILDYGPAIEHLQWSTGKILNDKPTTYNDRDQTPVNNFDRRHLGNMTMREALGRSRNTTAIQALQEVGVDKAAEFARGLGIDTGNEDEPMHESYGLGGFTNGISSLDLAAAYAAFGNGGTYTKPYAIRKVVFPDGRELNLEPETHKAMEDYTAYMITDMLKSVVTASYGTGGSANVSGVPLAGKTGTTNFTPEQIEEHRYPDGAVPDSWFAGYSSRYSIAVWTGFEKRDDTTYLANADERRVPQHIFREMMSYLSADIDTPDFQMPDSVVRVGVERSTGLLPSPFTPSSEIIQELFVRGTEQTQVSEKFVDIEAPSGVRAVYQEDQDQIIVTWNYPQDLLDDVNFEVRLSINGGSNETVQQSNDMQYIYSNPEPGSTYEFSITAEYEGETSDPARASVEIPDAIEEEEPEPEEENVEEDTEDNNDEDQTEDGNGDDSGEDTGSDENEDDNGGEEENNNEGTRPEDEEQEEDIETEEE